MKAPSRMLLLAVLVYSALAPPAARALPQEPRPSAQAPAAQAPAAVPATPVPHDPLEEFVPKEKVKADSIVALPVDI